MFGLKMRLVAVAMLGLAACQPTPVADPVKIGRYRAPDAAMYSSAVLEEARLVGRWTQIAAFQPEKGACAAGGMDISQTPTGLSAAFRLCLSGAQLRGGGPMQPTGPGRFDVKGLPGPMWVLWADGDYRTLVLGTPSGAYGFVLNKGTSISADRIVAMREVLEWNGYALANLKMLR